MWGVFDVCDILRGYINTLYPVFPDIIKYIKTLNHLSTSDKNHTGNRIFKLMDDSILSELDYHKIWALDLFTTSTDWNSEDKFLSLLSQPTDMFSRRKLILAMGRASQRHWFQSRWRDLFDEPHWPRRALLAAASCMPKDARNHWYRSVEPRLDQLELAVMRWARDNPF
ncbi:hypothetical protein BEH94_00290 [Candidatus Altiarchaeales archaeon WOR_SM1_SCG]|nr:hypothetical protein BEH94_00290 [Candidatus Altiarchaeales archaeon WOR_SM1_SCG]